MQSAGLYVHVPFCKRKCLYCDFYSAADMSRADDYVRAVIRNIKAAGLTYDTVYFGGGTPSLLTAEQISDILSAADISYGSEISMECNPESADNAYFCGLKAAGVNRISFGVQSLDDGELAALGRLHNADKAREAVLSAYSAGFINISADLMIAIPMQTAESLDRTLDSLLRLPLTHVSAYLLKVEKGTPLSFDQTIAEKLPNEDETADMYLNAAKKLSAAGFDQYEISNFARNGFECRHNLKYWRCEEYFGIGPSAHSFLDGVRFYCPPDTEKFISAPLQEKISLGTGGDRDEKAMLALRLTKEGLRLADFPKAESRAEPLLKSGLVKKEQGALMLTAEGCLVSNEIICRLIG
ncbi:MAG: radical SAM family heme chaperone HemW [Oscillospiraceae bacterium]|nr:radical SAM family heme chaperone HemW [Oscillospiraceae bacterium]